MTDDFFGDPEGFGGTDYPEDYADLMKEIDQQNPQEIEVPTGPLDANPLLSDQDIKGIVDSIKEADRKADQALKYVELRNILDRAFSRAAHEKGAERHGDGQNFIDQPIISIGKLIGTNHFQLGQALKKLLESVKLERAGFVQKANIERLDAIVYLAGAIYLSEIGIVPWSEKK